MSLALKKLHPDLLWFVCFLRGWAIQDDFIFFLLPYKLTVRSTLCPFFLFLFWVINPNPRFYLHTAYNSSLEVSPPVCGCYLCSFDIPSIVFPLLRLRTKPLLSPSALTVTLAGVSRDLCGLASRPLVCLWFLFSSARLSFLLAAHRSLSLCSPFPSHPLVSTSSVPLPCALPTPSRPPFTSLESSPSPPLLLVWQSARGLVVLLSSL